METTLHLCSTQFCNMKQQSAFVLLLLCAGIIQEAKPIALQPRITNSEPVTIFQFPFQVFLQTVYPGFGPWQPCGGVIVGTQWALTAAHCIVTMTDDQLNQLIVVAGVTRISEQNQGQRIRVIRHTVHPDYRAPPYETPHDIAVLKLATPLSFNPSVQPAQLPPPGQEPLGTAVVSGWGTTTFYPKQNTPVYPDQLRASEQTIQLGIVCTTYYSTYNPNYRFDVINNVCARSVNNGAQCLGDSGGPLSQGRLLLGLTAWGNDECANGPSVYTKVSRYLNFIYSNMN